LVYSLVLACSQILKSLRPKDAQTDKSEAWTVRVYHCQ